MSDDIQATVAYALAEKQYLLPVRLAAGTTLEQAIRLSGILHLRQEIDLTVNKIGVYSRPAALSDLVQPGDRIEIYRPLTADPKALRRARAARQMPPSTQ